MTAFVFKRKSGTITRTDATIIRYVNETKFSFEYEVCFCENNENNENKNVIIEIQKKHLSKVEEKYFKNANVGDRIEFIVEKKLEKMWRVKLLMR
jgi:hypothetical protein